MENNKLIAKFDGKSFYDPSDKDWNGERRDFELSQLKYHESWDWLMPVVEKIEELDYWVRIYGVGAVIEPFEKGKGFFKMFTGKTKLEAVYIAAVHFIKWYNQQKY